MDQSNGIAPSNTRCASLYPQVVLLILVAGLATLLGPAPLYAGEEACDCASCHGAPHGGGFTGCVACHQSPPATGAHAIHFAATDPPTDVSYGDVGVHSTTDDYRFGCGNCHPLDWAKHMNGEVDVELYDVNAPAGSIKSKNPANSTWDPFTRTCANVYCHSGVSVSSSAVSSPLKSPPAPLPPGYTRNNTYIMDESCSTLTYNYTMTIGRSYAPIPAWDSPPSFSTCGECHGIPPTTSYPTTQAGVGDTHQWIDDYGYGNLHAYNMSFEPIQCRTCHYQTVTEAGTYGRDGMDVTTYGPVPIANHAAHVNGIPDVALDTVDPVVYNNPYSLAGATWDPVAKSCSNVACHKSAATGTSTARYQTTPAWGAPYRWWSSPECDLCHRLGVLQPTCENGN